MKYKVDFAYKYTRKADEYIAPHRHNGLEVVYFLSGSGKTFINGTEYSLKAGDFCVVHPLSVHDEWHYSDCSVIFACFRFENDYHNLAEGIFSDAPEIKNVLESVFSEIKEQKDGYSEILELKAAEMFIYLSRIGKPKNSGIRNFGFAASFIQENYAQKIDYHALAALCGYSYDYFRHSFKKTTGLSPQDYHIHARLEQGRHMLTLSDRTVTEISESCGFSTNAQFSAMFRKKYGTTPNEYRKNTRTGKIRAGGFFDTK